MPKRKRGLDGTENDPARAQEQQQIELAQKLAHSKKLLHRALKTAKGFERQKLGKRLKLAKDKGDDQELQRLETELNVLKVGRTGSSQRREQG